jgi:hypothetical protein
LTHWEKLIVGTFAQRYPGSAAATGNEGRSLRLRPDSVFPGLDRASPDDRESFLEAAESLERRGLLSLVWARHRKGEALSALICRDPELLFELAGRPSPKTIAEDVRDLARTVAAAAEAYRRTMNGAAGIASEETALFSFLAENFTPLDAASGVDAAALTDLARLTGFLFKKDGEEPPPGIGEKSGTLPEFLPEGTPPGRPRGITTRALSVALYGNSKRLEALIGLFNPLLNRARRQGIAIPDFSFLDRSFPETFIAGKIALCFGEDEPSRPPETPLVNAGGNILGLPLGTILKLRRIKPLEKEAAPGVPGLTASEPAPAVLTIENKETFFALAESLPGYACFLYTGGHPNRAVRALVSLLAESGFAFYHAGDLDPEGILILQELGEIAGKQVRPLNMDKAVFDSYLPCGRKLEPSMLKRTKLISQKTRAIPGMEELIARIEETGMGVEQEIINYFGADSLP